MDAMRRPSAEAKPVAVEEPGATLEIVLERGAFRKVHRVWVLPLALIGLISVVILHGVHTGEFDYNVDEAQHGVTGLFLADAMHDLPVSHPIQYAYSYYAQYPAVSIVHWPPLFYVFEGLSFLVQGPSAFSARLTVALFAVLLLYNWFRLVEELQDAFTAAVSMAVLGLLPLMLLFEKAVMLEIPSLALVVCSIRYWIDYLDNGQKRSLYAFGLWLSAALLCKQTSVFVLLFCVLTLVATGKWDRLRNRDAAKVAALVSLLVGPFYGFMLVSQGSAVAQDLGSHQMVGVARWTFYLRTLPRLFTAPLLALSVLGIALAKRWNAKEQFSVMICWLVAGYATFTFFGQREERFAIYWFPVLVYFAAGLLTQYFQLTRVRFAMRWLAVVVVCFLAARGWSYERPYISGYENVASRLVQTYGSGIVLFDGRVPGNFVFYMRALDPHRQFLVLRKSLYVNDVRPSATSQELVHSREDIMDLFKNLGIRFAVVSDEDPEFNSQRILRDFVQGAQFQLLGRFPIASNQANWNGYNLILYENKNWAPPVNKWLTIRMLTLSHDIVVPLDRFEFVHSATGPTGMVGK
jgi:hypothetical protein